MDDEKKTFVDRLFAAHSGTLKGFFHRRIRNKHDAQDLAQEVYLRMLRVKDVALIENPLAYLFAIASHLVQENAIPDRRAANAVRIDDEEIHEQLGHLPDLEGEFDRARRVKRLKEVLPQLSSKCHATIVMQYFHGMSYQEIADALDISIHQVKKYHSQALAHCQRRMTSLR